jgi:type IV pilus assembly protein PilB
MDSTFIKINLASYLIEDELIKDIPGALAKKHNFMPVFKIGDTLTIATSEPDNLVLLDELQNELGMEIDVLLATTEDINNAIEQHYGVMDLIEASVTEAEQRESYERDLGIQENIKVSTSEMSDSSIVNLVNLIISQAALRKASDIHIEPLEKEIIVRLRIDGEMSEMKKIPYKLLLPIVSRIKVMSGMDIAESRIPQDGHINMTIDGKAVELRVSSLPTIFGENIVIRLLPKGGITFSLKDLGFADKIADTFSKAIRSPYGIILVTGPTGSGKTTTLYAVLNEINDISKNIITLEDPVESQIELVRQVQINPKAGLHFSTGLRSILRQDPDVIMVGEIRDLETAELAIRSALTGHLVFSTLHTNDSPSALIRLIDMGVEPFLVSSSILAVLAQRLVRTICKKCKTEYKPTADELDLLGLDESKTYYKGRGCKACNKTGYKGRTGIYELLILNENMKEQLIKRVSALELRRIALDLGLLSMQLDGIEKIEAGVTTPEEVLKVTDFLKAK